MGQPMPATTECSVCSRTLPVRAQIEVDGGTLPMFVVLTDVGTVEEALAQATCQMCLNNEGPPERDLYKILLSLGYESVAPAVPSLGGIPSGRGRPTAPSLLGVSIVDGWNRDPTRPSLAGVTIERPHRPREGWHPPPSEPRLPRVLRPAERASDPESEVEHLAGSIGDSAANQAVLEAIEERIRVRDEARRLERAAKFEKLMHWLKLTLAKIRKRARTQEIWDLVESFQEKLVEAVKLDPDKSGKKKVLETLGTSQEELESLCHLFYQSRERGHIDNPEIVTLDAFEGGRRSEFWDAKGGRKPAFYQFEIVRTKSTLPVPNPSLPGGDDDPRPRIVYPQGGEYGPAYTVENSRHLAGVDDKIDQICNEVTRLLAYWLARWHVELDIGAQCSRFDLTAQIPDFFVTLRRILGEEEAEALAEQADHAVEPTTISPDLPATT